MSEQNFANHTRRVPPFHFFAMPVFMIHFFWSMYRLWQLGFSFAGIFGVILAAALVILPLSARMFALTVQDRVIRLEERLRYERVLPAELQSRCGELNLGQIVSLRFACDAELPALARKATTAATSSGVSKRFKSEEGRTVEKNCFSISAFVTSCCLAIPSTKLPTPSEAVGPARMEFTVTPVPATDSAKPRATAT